MRLISRFATTVLFVVFVFSSAAVYAQKDGSNAAKGSLFSKLKLDMGTSQIYDVIGQPNDTKTYETGKRWIPFYHGPDTRRTELIYKNEGRLTIGGNGRLIAITVDTSEDGYQ